MKIFSIIIILLLISFNQLFSEIKLSSNAEISVITCSEGQELYSAFGHTAIRVMDYSQNLDIVFNYGTFNFNTPNFYLKFINGKLNYQLTISEFDRFLKSYQYENRSVKEQVLSLDSIQKNLIFNALILNYQPENRYYKYDFFYDNCATRVYSLLVDNCQYSIETEETIGQNNKVTFREYLDHYIIESKWIRFGLKTILGMPADKIATLKESTYLPDFLFNVLNDASFITPLKKQKLVKQVNIIYQPELSLENSSALSPLLIFSGILLIIILFQLFRKKFQFFNVVIFRLLFVLTGFVGILILYLWFVTDHSVTANNLNILWSMPTILVVATCKWSNKFVQLILKFNISMYTLFLIAFSWLPQSLPSESIIIILILGISQMFILKKNKQTQI